MARKSLLDKAISSFAPQWAWNRVVARNKLNAFSSSYRATSTGRTRWSRGMQGGTGDYHLSTHDIESLRGQHRDFDRNNAIFSGILNRWVDNVVGMGFTFQMKTEDEGLNQAVEDRVREWGEKEADYRGILSLWEMQRLLLREVACGGDMLFAKVKGKLQPIEPDLCVSNFQKDPLNTYNGVEKNEAGKVVAYHIGKWTPYGNVDATDTKAIKPSKLFHIFNPKRFSQSRGVPILTGALELFERIDDYVEATLVAAQVGACQSAVVTTDAGSALGVAVTEQTETSSDDEDMPTREMEPGMTWFLKPGEDVKTVNPEQPTSEFEPFIATLLRFVGLELGMPLELVLLDYSKTNYSSAKAALTQSAITFRVWQRLINMRFLNPLTDWKMPRWLRDVGANVSAEEVPYIWVPPGWKWIDPPREAKAHIDAAAAGIETLQQIAAEAGGFWRDNLNQRGREIKAAKELAAELNEGEGGEVSWRDCIPAVKESGGFGGNDAGEVPEDGGEAPNSGAGRKSGKE